MSIPKEKVPVEKISDTKSASPVASSDSSLAPLLSTEPVLKDDLNIEQITHHTSVPSEPSEEERVGGAPNVYAENFGFVLQAGLSRAFELFFNPPCELLNDGFALDLKSLQDSVAILGDQSLQQKVGDFTTGPLATEFTTPIMAEAELRTIQRAIVGAALHSRPQDFIDAPDSLTIAQNILRGFVDDGAMSGWARLGQDAIEKSDASEQEKAGLSWLLDGFAWGLRELAANRSPMSSLVDAELQTKGAQSTESPSSEQSSSESDSSTFLDFDSVNPRLAAQTRVLKKASQKALSLLRSFKPDLPDTNDPEELIEQIRKDGEPSQKQEFAQKLLSMHELGSNIFESDYLRAFDAHIIYIQSSKLFYEFVYKSCNPEFCNTESHNIAKALWLLSQLDVINSKPRVARLRMPDASVDGDSAHNFGYKMDTSTSYTNWLRQPLARACGDVVMDAFHAVVDFGKDLDIELFVTRIVNKVYHGSQQQDKIEITRNDQYDTHLIDVLFFLLGNTFATKFIVGESVVKQLAIGAGSEDNLRTKVRELLGDFQKFSELLYELRPGTSGTNDSKEFVFGIGFNGKLFGAPSNSLHNKNEIWFDFSESSRRHPGSKFFSHLLIVFSSSKNHKLVENIDWGTPHGYYLRYKQLIKRQVSLQAKRYKVIEELRILYEKFLLQLEVEGLAFDKLDKDLRDWISDLKNWYFLPITNSYIDPGNQTEIKLAEPLPDIEHGVQYLTREFLLSVICRRDIISEYPVLVPYLYLYLRREICEKLGSSEQELRNNIGKITKFTDFDDINQQKIKNIITEIVSTITLHPDVRAIWNKEEIDRYYRIFCSDFTARQAQREEPVKRLKEKIEYFSKMIEKTPRDKRTSLEAELKRARLDLEKELKFIQETLPASPKELSLERYNDFKKLFFNNRKVGQCVESSFARVLGHDKFFPILITRAQPKENIKDPLSEPPYQLNLTLGRRFPQNVIPPCGPICQHHVTAHLMVGDLLRQQSVDRLNAQREMHGIPIAPARVVLPILRSWSVLPQDRIAQTQDFEYVRDDHKTSMQQSVSPR